MTGTQSISVDSTGQIVTMRLTGFFDPAGLATFSVERARVWDELTCAPNEQICIVDVSECEIQAQGTAQDFARLMADPDRRSRKLAFVSSGALARLQIKRLTAFRSDVVIFDSVAEAEEWAKRELAFAVRTVRHAS